MFVFVVRSDQKKNFNTLVLSTFIGTDIFVLSTNSSVLGNQLISFLDLHLTLISWINSALNIKIKINK